MGLGVGNLFADKGDRAAAARKRKLAADRKKNANKPKRKDNRPVNPKKAAALKNQKYM